MTKQQKCTRIMKLLNNCLALYTGGGKIRKNAYSMTVNGVDKGYFSTVADMARVAGVRQYYIKNHLHTENKTLEEMGIIIKRINTDTYKNIHKYDQEE